MEISCSVIKFVIHVDFPECDVDMVYNEISSPTPVASPLIDGAVISIDKSKLSKTPIAESVDFALSYLMGYADEVTMSRIHHKVKITELEKLGVNVESYYGLMMGTCHIVLCVEPEKFSQELVEKCKSVILSTFKKFVKFYKN